MKPRRTPILLFVAMAVLFSATSQADGWKPAEAPLQTPWTAMVDPASPLPEHPRPDFRRQAWMSLNGLWDYSLEPVDFEKMQGFIDRDSMTEGTFPAKAAGRILVPFAIDSPLSGIMHVLRPEERLWYRRSFEVPDHWNDHRVLLHFEASDWETSVYLNGHRLGQHRGGYDPFVFDITDHLKATQNSLIVCVWDGTEQHCQPVGKQIMPENRKGFRYQPTGGIWQTVWLEAVGEASLDSVKITPSLTGAIIAPSVRGSSEGLEFKVTAREGDTVVATASGATSNSLELRIPQPKLWSPKSPHLYDLTLELVRDGKTIDSVESYCGLRTIDRNDDGRLMLNGKPAPFQFGPLDQGYWPDGILTPPHEEAIKFDLEYLKSIGCNMVRVHIKVHPRRWYYHADRLGLLVWQDMICTPKYGQTVDRAGSANWRREFREIITDFQNHPSIINWIVFNEAWGQHASRENTAFAASLDPTRLTQNVSGWSDHGLGEILDVHDYATYPSAAVADGFGNHRALVFGEIGGHNLLMPGKKWYPDQQAKPAVPIERSMSRINFDSVKDLRAKYPFYFRNMRHFIARRGYQAFVYTQISDIEHECNGWLTYDRKVSKIPAEDFRRIHDSLTQPIEYTLLAGEGPWTAGSVMPTGRRGEPRAKPWTKANFTGRFEAAQLPHRSKPLSEIAAGKAIGLRTVFDIKEQPKNAVLEIIATHRDAYGDPPQPILDGHRGRARKGVNVVTFLDGDFHRRGSVAVESGQGRGVTFLELTESEVDLLTAGKHTLAVEVSAPESVTEFDILLWSYTE